MSSGGVRDSNSNSSLGLSSTNPSGVGNSKSWVRSSKDSLYVLSDLSLIHIFDDDRMEIMKIMYPRIVDKEAFFTVINTLTFSSSKEKMKDFIIGYGKR